MDAVKYLKAKKRMCDLFDCCNGCPLEDSNTDGWCGEHKRPEEIVEIVEQWAKENPPRTYLSVLLEKLPNAKLDEYGTPKKFCPKDIFKTPDERCAGAICSDCWNREYKEEI